MQPDQLTQEKILKVVEDLEKEKKSLEKKLNDERAINRSAWSMYGSELCSGSMMSKEREIEQSLRDIQRDINLLTDLFDGKISFEHEPVVIMEMNEIDKKIEELTCEKNKGTEKIIQFAKIRRLLEK